VTGRLNVCIKLELVYATVEELGRDLVESRQLHEYIEDSGERLKSQTRSRRRPKRR
jgi:hypothetical protein